ncbi:MAG: hypothetical protein AAFZ38_12420, partial [Myxococcota bacterium]
MDSTNSDDPIDIGGPDDRDADGVPDDRDCAPDDRRYADFELYYFDADGDGVGVSPGSRYCPNDVPSGWVTQTGDECPAIRARTKKGSCGCAPDKKLYYRDTDGDGVGGDTSALYCDANAPSGWVTTTGDECDTDPDKRYVGFCGCGFEERIEDHFFDSDGDGIGFSSGLSWCVDQQPSGFVLSVGDNCPDDANVNQRDIDGDGLGDVCDNDQDGDTLSVAYDCDDRDPSVGEPSFYFPDEDADGIGYESERASYCPADSIPTNWVRNVGDNCPSVANPDQTNSDSDSVGDACDQCPGQFDYESDLDEDGVDDGCDPDRDGDGVENAEDCDQWLATCSTDCADRDGNGLADCRIDDCDRNGDGTCSDLDRLEPLVGLSCLAGTGACQSRGIWIAGADGLSCEAMSAPTPTAEECNFIDDDCDGEVDEDCSSSCASPGYAALSVSGTTAPSCAPIALHDPSLYSPQPNETTPLSATVSVSPNGEVTASVALPVLPGRGGIEPALALVYRGAAPGEYGVGFGLAGESRIHRCNRTLAYDAEIAPVEFRSTDKLCLDGAPLAPWHENTCEAGFTELRPQDDYRTKVCVLGDSINTPRGFAVFRQDGEIHYYGTGLNSRELVQSRGGYAATWKLAHVVDRFGNGRSYHYVDATEPWREDPVDGDTFASVLHRITYSEHFADRLDPESFEPGLREVRFYREALNSPWASGFFEEMAYEYRHVVTHIEMRGPGDDEAMSVRTVALSYDHSFPEPVLTRVDLHSGPRSHAESAAQMAAPVTFEYAPASGAQFADAAIDHEFPGSQLFDLSGDGVLQWTELDDEDPEGIRVVYGGASGALLTETVAAIDPQGAHLADVNSDSRADLITCDDGKLLVFPRLSEREAGTEGFGPGAVVANGCTDVLASSDLNGDGHLELIAMLSGGQAEAYFRQDDGSWVGHDLGFSSEPALVDLNRDGVLDFFNGPAEASRTDGRDYATCSGTFESVECRMESLPAVAPDPVLGGFNDVNSDGYADVVASGLCSEPNRSWVNIHLNRGDNTFYRAKGSGCILGAFQSLVELDGDRLPEIVMAG